MALARLVRPWWSVAALTAATLSSVSTATASTAPGPSAPSVVESAKRAAARKAVDDYVRDGMAVGVGSGSTIVYAAQRLAERAASEGLRIVCVPTSFQAAQLLWELNLPCSDLSRTPSLDVAIDGADECDRSLSLIKGGGGCQTQEKVVASCAAVFVVVADHRKQSHALGTKWTKGVPVEVLPFAYVPVMRKLEAMGGKPRLRMAVAKAGPVVTDNGNFVVDVDFGPIYDPGRVDTAIRALPGVVETGLFVSMAARAYFGQPDGTVVEWTPE